ncbi:C-type lectin domain family 4 member F-like isoform X3 [Alosa sapidissima]|uniref:C-type lectin domain family 4 member F-like isoform X3 n=1 Tax=Alosa sapidissima TaxID=34773 RepID=UPI001C0A5482|nr:C-type lectin domain family 4 member F-like isoform X3 [Alosa sapidissima]
MLQPADIQMDEGAIYDNIVMDAEISKPASTAEGTDEYVNKRSSRSPEKPFTSSTSVQKNIWLQWVTVAVGVLCVLLVLLTTGLCVKYNTGRDQLKMELDQLKIKQDHLKTERDQLKTDCNLFKSKWSNVTKERDQLLSSNSNLMRERDRLQNIIDQVPCPRGWKLYGKCYLISSSAKTWSEARQDCQAMGADLVTIDSEEEQAYISGLGRWGWIGLQRRGTSWTWVNGRPLSISRGPVIWGSG